MEKGDRIRKLRIEKGITQEEMAKRLNTTKQTISKYEKSIVTNIPSDRLEEMAEILGTTPGYILGWEEIQNKNDAITDIIVRLRTDKEFFETVELLHYLDDEKLKNVKQTLTFIK